MSTEDSPGLFTQHSHLRHFPKDVVPVVLPCAQVLASIPCCLLQLMPLLGAALFAKVPTEGLHRLLTGQSQWALSSRRLAACRYSCPLQALHYSLAVCLLQLTPLLEAALFAKVPTEDLQRLLTGESHLGPFFKWTGALRAAFASAESYNEASGKWGAVSRRLMAACLRNKNVASLKVGATLHLEKVMKIPKVGRKTRQMST